ncbi:MAG TPA: DUF4833 domain-containing protein [Bacteroidia bacterium]|nr:DUF4833 domain-containing protein [Bacteroidia bacterium]
MNYYKVVLLSFSLLIYSFQPKAQTQAEQTLTNTVAQFTKNFPVPPSSKSLLFYLQRNKNTNTIIYEANYLSNGKLDPKNPVSVYWLRYTEGGEKKELTWIQRWLAFGVDFEPAKDGSDNFILSFVALKNRKVTLTLDADGKAIAYLPLNGKNARLTRIYAQAQETNWLPSVKFVQVMGEELKSKQPVIEYIFPKQQ